MPDEALYRHLTHLQVTEFLYETRLFPEREYTFKHALTHEVAYGSLLQERRRALHAQIVEAIELLYPDHLADQVERLAYHALRSEVWDKAFAYLRQAGTKAMERSANREAVTCFEQALEVLQYLPERRDTIVQGIDVRFDLRNALLALGAFERLLDYLHDAERLATILNDQLRLGWVACYIVNYFYRTGAYDRALAAGQRALTFATACGDTTLQVATHFQLGLAYWCLGDYERAIDLNRSIVASLEGDMLYERFGLAGFPSVLSRMTLVWCLAERGEFAEGLARGEEGMRIAETTDHPENLVRIYWAVGHLSLCRGDFQKAIPRLERGLVLCQVANIPAMYPFIASHLGYAYTLSARVAEALPLLEQAVEQAISMNMMTYQSLSVAYLSETLLRVGRMEDAHVFAEQALTLAREHHERGNQVYALRLLGEIASHREPPKAEQAEAHYSQALVLAEELSMRPLQAHCHLGLGTLYTKTGQREQACTALTAAIDLYRAMDMTFWLPKTEAVLAQVSG
jgi:tetratricopeptide (TPR) repeat protein